jgi:Ser/Thr protein kinase RdoA (MazF antagonist)
VRRRLGTIQSAARVGGTNDNFAVTTDRGEFIVKFIVNATVEDFARGLPFLDRLEAAGFPLSVPYLRVPDGAVVYHDGEGAAVVLHRLAADPLP